MKSLFWSTADYLKEKGWPCTLTEDPAHLKANVCTKIGRWTFTAFLDVLHKVVVFQSIFPLHVPADRLTKVAEFLMRVNRWNFVGSFVMDFDGGGEVRVITYMPITPEPSSSESEQETCAAACRLVEKNMRVMDKYLPGILRVLSSDTTPAEAYSEILTRMPVDRKYLYN